MMTVNVDAKTAPRGRRYFLYRLLKFSVCGCFIYLLSSSSLSHFFRCDRDYVACYVHQVQHASEKDFSHDRHCSKRQRFKEYHYDRQPQQA